MIHGGHKWIGQKEKSMPPSLPYTVYLYLNADSGKMKKLEQKAPHASLPFYYVECFFKNTSFMLVTVNVYSSHVLLFTLHSSLYLWKICFRFCSELIFFPQCIWTHLEIYPSVIQIENICVCVCVCCVQMYLCNVSFLT